MKPEWKKTFRVGVILVMLGAGACASTPQAFDYHDDRDEKPGPGLFSGEAGGFVIQRGTGEKTPDPENGSAVKE